MAKTVAAESPGLHDRDGAERPHPAAAWRKQARRGGSSHGYAPAGPVEPCKGPPEVPGLLVWQL